MNQAQSACKYIAQNISPPIITAIIIAVQCISTTTSHLLDYLRIKTSFAFIIIGAAFFISGKITLYSQSFTRLATSGAYKISRNPSYLGLQLIVFGIALYMWNIIALLTSYFYFVLFDSYLVPIEEEMLRDTFKDEYKNYEESVKRWI